MGHRYGRSSEEQHAIAQGLSEMHVSAEEELIEFLAMCDNEDSHAIQEERELQQRVVCVYTEIRRRGITPDAWFCELFAPTTWDCRIRDALIERWETDMMIESIIDEDDGARAAKSFLRERLH